MYRNFFKRVIDYFFVIIIVICFGWILVLILLTYILTFQFPFSTPSRSPRRLRFSPSSSSQSLKQIGFPSVKLNTVLMRGKNENEILPLLNFAAEHDVAIRFIELMPVSLTEMLSEKNFLPVQEVFAMLKREDELEPLAEPLGFGPAKYFRLKQRGVTVGLIGALSDLHFCERCNKMRLTCDGKLRPCLGNHLETDLKPALRPELNLEKLENLFRGTLSQKPPEHLFRNNYQPQRVMTAIGG